MSDTVFTLSPDWGWYIVLYFFVGGIAGGCCFLATLLHFFGRPEDRPVIRLAYYVGLCGAVVSGALLTLDLTRPLRFWHMMIQSNTGAPMFKAWSPMSVGVWGLLLFGAASFLAALGAAAEEGRLRTPALRVLLRPPVAAAVAALAGLSGFFLAGYTGILLSVTNRPIWADSQLVGALFLVSGGSTAAAALIALAHWRRLEAHSTVQWLARFDRNALGLELAVLAVFLVSLGTMIRAFVGGWGVLLLVGVVGGGIVAPLLLHRGPTAHAPRTLLRSASLVLAGGLLLRVVVIFASNAIHATGAGISGR
ncbi:MAG: NrfD/PsrC family molybdoenzyme membrane anchor subunit [Gemmatimonadales bacterium]